MLGKLMKYEFRATGQSMLPLLAFVLVAALGVNIMERITQHSESDAVGFLAGLLMFVFIMAIVVLSVMAVFIMAQRFYRNFLTDEGYLMFTLPASVHSLLWSKIFVSSIWFAAVGAADVLAVLIASFQVSNVSRFISSLTDMFKSLTAQYALNGAAFIAESIVVIFLACAVTCLMFYAAMAVGFSFPRHKWFMSVLFFFIFTIALQICGFGGMFTWVNVGGGPAMSALTMMHTTMGVAMGIEALLGAVFYVLTALMLKKSLNLE